jgi:hypothetical protein
MSMRSRILAVSLAGTALATSPCLAAQMHESPARVHGQAMQGQAMHGQAMQGHMVDAERMMRHAGVMMNNADAMMRDMAAFRSSMHAGEHLALHDQMMKSFDTMLAHMREVHGNLQQHLHDPALMQNRGARDHMQDACRDLERMAGAFEQMTKHMSQALKGLPHDRK